MQRNGGGICINTHTCARAVVAASLIRQLCVCTTYTCKFKPPALSLLDLLLQLCQYAAAAAMCSVLHFSLSLRKGAVSVTH